MWGRFNPKPDHPSIEMQRFARQLLDKLKPYLPTEEARVWLTVPSEMGKGQMIELGIEISKVYSGDIYVSCCFENRSEHFGSSDAVKHGTKDEVATWLEDDNNLEDVAMMLQDLYENTRTWD